MPRRRYRINSPLCWLIGAIVLAISLYVFGLSWIQSRGSTIYGPRSLWVPRLTDVVIFAWLMWIGSAVGSFLNVVAWRMPRGESVNGRSYCPRCHTQLRWRDNFPVFGWILLRGRCRTCRLPISSRYPMVEAIVGVSITLVGVAEMYRLSIPGQTLHWHGGPFWTPIVDQTLLIKLLYHMVALSISWAMGLIRMDGHPLPRRLVTFAAIALIVPMLIDPRLMIVTWQAVVPNDWDPAGMHLDALVKVLTGLAMAVVLGRYLARGLCPGADPKLDPLSSKTTKLLDLITIISVPAIVIGWQAAPMVVVLASLIATAARRWLPGQVDALGRLAISMPLALTVQLVLWRRLDESGWWPTAGSPPWLILASVALLFFVPLWLHDPRREPILIEPAGEPDQS